MKRQASSRCRPDSPDTDSVGQPDSRAAAPATLTGDTLGTQGTTGAYQDSKTDRKAGKRESGAPICGNKRGDTRGGGRQHGLQAAHSRDPVLHISGASWT